VRSLAFTDRSRTTHGPNPPGDNAQTNPGSSIGKQPPARRRHRGVPYDTVPADDPDLLPVGAPLTLEAWRRGHGEAPATSNGATAAATPRQRGRPPGRASAKRKPLRRCAQCGGALRAEQAKFCSTACRYPDRPVPESRYLVSEPQNGSQGEQAADGAAEGTAELAWLKDLPPYVLAVELEGWRLVRA
jgi:hypothetical protein